MLLWTMHNAHATM